MYVSTSCRIDAAMLQYLVLVVMYHLRWYITTSTKHYCTTASIFTASYGSCELQYVHAVMDHAAAATLQQHDTSQHAV